MFFRQLLDFFRANACLNHHKHIDRIKLNYFVHFFQRQNNSAKDRHGAAGKPRSCAPWNNGDHFPVGKLDDLCNLFRGFRKNHHFRQMMITGIAHFVIAIRMYFVRVGRNVLFADNPGELFNHCRRNFIIASRWRC